MTKILYQKLFVIFFQKTNMAKIMANVQKRLKGASVEADFWYGENIGLAEKKAPNSNFH